MNKTLKNLFMLLIGAILMVSCAKKESVKPAPIANFTMNPPTGRAPVTITFTNTSQNATSYSWDFGGLLTSTDANPVIAFSGGGILTVTLTAKGDGGTTIISKTITIQNPYTKVKIKKITITAMPFTTPSGAGWDVTSGPDVYMKILSPNPNNTTLITGGVFNDVLQSSLPIAWNVTPLLQVPTLNEFYYVNLYDSDSPPIDPDDNMGFVGFRMDNYMTGAGAFPAQITLTQNGITAILDLQWEE